MWEIYTCGELPYGNMKNVDVFDYVCQSGNRLEQPTNCPAFVYEAMLKCFDHVSIYSSISFYEQSCIEKSCIMYTQLDIPQVKCCT